MGSDAGRAALEIAADYLDSSEKQVLRNVATALAAIDTPQSAAHLADLAILEEDPEVRERAVAEATRLGDKARHAAADRAARWLIEPPRPEGASRLGTVRENAIRGHANDLLVALERQCEDLKAPELALDSLPALPGKILRRFEPLLGLLWTRLWTLTLYTRMRGYLLRRHPPAPLWWPVVLGFFGALPGAAITAGLFTAWHAPIGRQAVLVLCLAPAMVSAFLIAAVSRSSIPHEHYCNRRVGALVEAFGFLWRPGKGALHTLVAPIAIALVSASAVVSLFVGFGGLGLDLLACLSWVVFACVTLTVVLVIMRAAAVTEPRLGRLGSTLFGAFAGLAIALMSLYESLRLWPHPEIAILNSEAVVLLPALTTAFITERLFGSAVVARGPSRTAIASVAAMILALAPGLWFHFNPSQAPRAPYREVAREDSWWLAKVPVWRQFQVDFKQRVRAEIEADESFTDDTRLLFDLRRGSEKIAPDVTLAGGAEWVLPPGDYELTVTAPGAGVEKKKYGFLVRETYASAVSLLARQMLVSSGREVPAHLVGAFELELILNADAAPRSRF